MNLQIETLRGVACLLLVLYHVIGADPDTGLEVADGVVRWGNDVLAYLRMPLFTFLSGIVYGWRPFQGDSRRFLLGKVRRLLVPMLVVGTVFAVLQAAVPGTNRLTTHWWQLHWLPVAHFWFVESLFWVFLAVWGLERLQWMSTPRRMVLAWAASCGVYLLAPGGWYQLSIEGAFYLFPYFMLGLLVARCQWQPRLRQPSVIWLGLLLLVCLAAWQQGVPTPGMNRRVPWILVMGSALCLLALAWVRPVAWVGRIGAASYAIYLFHVFFTAAVRIVLIRLEVATLWVLIPAGLLAGVLGPMAVNHVASRHPWSALLLLGKSAKRRASSRGD